MAREDRAVPARVYRLGEEPADTSYEAITVAERLAIVQMLSERMLLLQGSRMQPMRRDLVVVRPISRRD
jgi:hypothetical protein